MNEVYNYIKEESIGRVEKNVKMSKYTTYRVGGICKYMVFPKTVNCLIKLIKIIDKYSVKYKVIGSGSNLLFSDDIYDGFIIKLDELKDLEFVSPTKIKVGAGYSLIKLSYLLAKNGLTGLEFASGIPGTVGGAIFMNAGAYKSDMGYVVTEVKVLTPKYKVITLVNKELDFHYRTSFLQKNPGYICLDATIKLEHGNKKVIEEVITDRKKRRIESQPLEYPSAGSVFRNPKDMFAGKLVEDLGFKGMKIGGALVSDKHANFIVNYDNAKASDIKSLIDQIKDKVKEECDIDLKVEQELVNWE